MKGFQAKVTKGYFVNPGNGTIRNDFNKEVQHFCTSKRTFLSKRTEAQKDLKLRRSFTIQTSIGSLSNPARSNGAA